MKENNNLLNEEKFRQKEAAELLRMSVSKICRLTQTGKIGCYRLSSGIVLYGRSHLEAFLNQSEHKAKAA